MIISPLAMPLMIVAGVLVVVSPFAGSIGRLIVNGVATGRGYVLCPLPIDPRHQPDRWTLPGPGRPTARCPA